MINKLMHQLSMTVKQNVLSVFAILALFAAACGGGGDSSSSGGGSSTGTTGTSTGTTTGSTTGPVVVPAIVVTNLDKGANELRTHYAAFSIQTNHVSLDGFYTLALRLKDDPKPSPADIKASKAVFQRNIVSTEVDYMYMAFHMDAPIFADAYVMDKLVEDGSPDYAPEDLTARTLLLPNRTYTLYVLDSTTDTLYTLNDFTTDGTPDSTKARMYGAPPNDKIYSVRLNEPFIIHTIFNSVRETSVSCGGFVTSFSAGGGPLFKISGGFYNVTARDFLINASVSKLNTTQRTICAFTDTGTDIITINFKQDN